MKQRIAAILARVSRPTQNMESQVNDLLRVADEMHYTVPSKFIFKEQISGVNRGRKESLENILAAIDDKKNNIEAVFIWEITRLNRDAMDFSSELQEFIKRSTPVFFLDVELWSMNPDTKELLRDNTNKILGASIYGLQEWNKIAKRTKRGRDALAKKGYYVGHLADGYIAVKEGEHKKIIPDDDRKQVIINIFDYFIEGKSTDEIAAILNAENVPTTAHYRVKSPLFNYKQHYHIRKGSIEYDRTLSKWSGTSVSSILSNEWYVGKRYYHIKEQEKLPKEDWEVYAIDPIITIEIWEKAQELRKERAIHFRSEKKSKKHNYILSNLVFCGNCGSKFYGHYTGKNNHYYCSAVEQGIECDTRGINKENFEAIVCQIVKYRALNTLVNDTPDVTTDFFRISDKEKQKIKREIDTIKVIISGIDKRIDDIETELYRLFDALGSANNPKYIYAAIDKREKEKADLKRDRENRMADIMLYNKKLNSSDNIHYLIKQIEQTNDIKELQQLVEATVSRITVHTIDKSINYVVVEYINGKTDSFVYSFRLLRHSYILVSNFTDKSKPIFEFDHQNKVLSICDDLHIAFKWQIKQYPIELVDSDMTDIEEQYGVDRLIGCFVALDEDNEITLANNLNIKTYCQQIDFRSLIAECKSAFLCIVYDPTPFIESDERREIQAKREKEYQAKRNSGLPSTLPYVVKDGNYEDYIKQRKHLYNRRYKIKKHKSLSNEEKQMQLKEIDNALALLRAKVKYLSREEAVKQYKQKLQKH